MDPRLQLRATTACCPRSNSTPDLVGDATCTARRGSTRRSGRLLSERWHENHPRRWTRPSQGIVSSPRGDGTAGTGCSCECGKYCWKAKMHRWRCAAIASRATSVQPKRIAWTMKTCSSAERCIFCQNLGYLPDSSGLPIRVPHRARWEPLRADGRNASSGRACQCPLDLD